MNFAHGQVFILVLSQWCVVIVMCCDFSYYIYGFWYAFGKKSNLSSFWFDSIFIWIDDILSSWLWLLCDDALGWLILRGIWHWMGCFLVQFNLIVEVNWLVSLIVIILRTFNHHFHLLFVFCFFKNHIFSFKIDTTQF